MGVLTKIVVKMNRETILRFMDVMSKIESDTDMNIHFISNEHIEKGQSYLHLHTDDYKQLEDVINEYKNSQKQ